MDNQASASLSVIIPAYNEAENITSLIDEIEQSLRDHCQYEIIVVDDGSNDDTWRVLNTLSASRPLIKSIRHRHNSGQSAALVTGVKQAQYALIATLDGDGQNDPADIMTLLDTLRSLPNNTHGYLIAGQRITRKDSFSKRLSSKVANNIRSKFLKDRCLDTGCGIKLFYRDAFLTLPHFNHLHRFLPALFNARGITTVNVPVNHRPRQFGVSKYGLNNRLWVGLIDMMGVLWLQKRNCHVDCTSEQGGE